MTRTSTPALAAVTAVAALAAWQAPRPARACAPAPRAGEHVDVAAEEAVIVWDPVARVQHFVRRADFSTAARDFGFLVPTPTRPELAQAADDVFRRLFLATRPEVRHEEGLRLEPTFLCAARSLREAAPPGATRGGVEVLEERRVAGYDAAVLAASDAPALLAWLAAHGYDARPALREWLDVYVRAGWVITAFKVAEPRTSAVRMSFAAERPFFPYREPTDQRAGGPGGRRSLRVFLVTPERRAASIGDSGRSPAELEWARGRDDLAGLLAGAVPAEAVRPGAWLHAWLDESSPRPGTDELYFDPAPAQTPVIPPPVIVRHDTRVPVPLEVPLVGLAGLVALRLWRRRRAAAAAAAPEGGK